MPSRGHAVVDEAARRRERSMLVACVSDIVVLIGMIVTALWANSLMLGAEALRNVLLITFQMLALLLLRNIHRGRTRSFDYGAGKLEHFANFGIGVAMGIGGLWVAAGAAYRWWHPPEQVRLGLEFAAAVSAIHVVQNALAFWLLWRSGRDGSSLIMLGQVRTRLAKVICSAVVLCGLAVNATFAGGPVGVAAEVMGSAFMALVMLQLALSMWRQALPSLLDRTLEESQQAMINRALASHFEDYDGLVAVRSRISGKTPLVEVVLGFIEDRKMGEIQRVVDNVASEVREHIPGALVTVVPTAWRPRGP
ncbi:MAG TPA: cation transporter [Acetobacteraceae bacterium]|jgi:cation diffusion facilitator family transporter|nr:cation transporter [Acetobacteraceae bacterium]